VKINLNVNKDDDNANAEQSAEAQSCRRGNREGRRRGRQAWGGPRRITPDAAAAQADFDNYRKRIEKERFEDSKRATARVIEGLIPVIDGFEHALARTAKPNTTITARALSSSTNSFWKA